MGVPYVNEYLFFSSENEVQDDGEPSFLSLFVLSQTSLLSLEWLEEFIVASRALSLFS